MAELRLVHTEAYGGSGAVAPLGTLLWSFLLGKKPEQAARWSPRLRKEDRFRETRKSSKLPRLNPPPSTVSGALRATPQPTCQPASTCGYDSDSSASPDHREKVTKKLGGAPQKLGARGFARLSKMQ